MTYHQNKANNYWPRVTQLINGNIFSSNITKYFNHYWVTERGREAKMSGKKVEEKNNNHRKGEDIGGTLGSREG